MRYKYLPELILTNFSHISGFRQHWPITGGFEWSDAKYVEFGLADPGKETDWYLHPENWRK